MCPTLSLITSSFGSIQYFKDALNHFDHMILHLWIAFIHEHAEKSEGQEFFFAEKAMLSYERIPSPGARDSRFVPLVKWVKGLCKKSSRRPTKRWQSGPEWKWKGRFAADPKKSLGFGLKSGRPRPLLKHLVLHTCVSNCPVFAIFGHAKWQTDDRARANIAWFNLPMKYKMWENTRLFQALIDLQHTCLNATMITRPACVQ